MATLDELFAGLSEKNKRIVIAGGAVIGTFLLTTNLVISPSLKQVKHLEKQKSDYMGKEPLMRQVIDSEKRIAAYKKYFLSNRDDLAGITEALVEKAKRGSLRVTSTSPVNSGIQSSEAEIEKLSVTLEAEGTFHQLGEFISQIENTEPFVKISRMDFGRGSNNKAGVAVKQMSITFSLFYASAQVVGV